MQPIGRRPRYRTLYSPVPRQPYTQGTSSQHHVIHSSTQAGDLRHEQPTEFRCRVVNFKAAEKSLGSLSPLHLAAGA